MFSQFGKLSVASQAISAVDHCWRLQINETLLPGRPRLRHESLPAEEVKALDADFQAAMQKIYGGMGHGWA